MEAGGLLTLTTPSKITGGTITDDSGGTHDHAGGTVDLGNQTATNHRRQLGDGNVNGSRHADDVTEQPTAEQAGTITVMIAATLTLNPAAPSPMPRLAAPSPSIAAAR